MMQPCNLMRKILHIHLHTQFHDTIPHIVHNTINVLNDGNKKKDNFRL